MILNLQYLGMDIIQNSDKVTNGGAQPHRVNIPQERRQREELYQLSRWTPYVKDLMEDVCEGKLSPRLFPSLSHSNRQKGGMGGFSFDGISARQNWLQKNPSTLRS